MSRTVSTPGTDAAVGMSSRPTTLDGVRALLNCLFALSQILVQALTPVLGGIDIGVRSAASPALFTPPDFTFAIWGLIFIGMTGYAVFQALPSNLADPRLRRIGWWTALAMAANTAWEVSVIYSGITIVSVILIFAMLAALLTAFLSLYRDGTPTTREQVFVIFPVSIFTGWITIAGLANTSSWLGNAGGFDGGTIPHGTWVAGLAIVGGVAAAATIVTNRGNAFYAAVIVWGLTGVAIKCAGLGETIAVGGTLAGIAITVVAYGWIRRSPRQTLRTESSR
jgi:translocator protein